MNMITIQWEIPEEMKPYIDSTNKLRQNAILLYPYILDKTISHGRAAEILGMSKLDLIDLILNRKRSIVSILTKKYLIASRQVLVCDNDPAVFLTKAIDLPENSDSCHPYDLGFLTANIQNNRMV